MAKENGFQSLKDDFAEALKNPKGQFGFKFFRKKYQQVRNTLRKCISDPLKLAFLDVLDQRVILVRIGIFSSVVLLFLFPSSLA